MNKESPKQSPAAQEFWDAFKACVEENRVRPDRLRMDIEDFLADLAQRSGVKDWQAGEDRSGG
jgi:hypothetical protein